MKKSAGLLMYRKGNSGIEVLLVHPGGPLWARRDLGSWSIPKGEYSPSEDALDAARREFKEETGFTADGEFSELPEIRQKGGKTVKAWAIEGECDPENMHSNTFTMEWPPRSGRMKEFPEVDRAGWFSIASARGKILESQRPLLDHLEKILSS